MSQRFKLRSLLRRTMNKVATPREKTTTSKNHHHRLQQHHHQLQGKLAPPSQGSVSLEQLASDSPAEAEAAVAGGDAGAAVVTSEGASSLPTLPTTAGTAEQLLWQQRQQQLIEAGRQELAALRAEIKRHKIQLSSGTAIGGSGAVSEPSVQQLHQLPRHHQLQLVEQLQAENKLLRSSLSEQLQRQGGEAAGPISDAEKQLLLANSCRARCSCSAPASIVGQDKTSRSSSGAVCMSKSASQEILMNSGQSQDWDKQSSSSMSEFSVADLQDRITQMEETHHSTNEELQATLQELQDLQLQLAADRLENQQLRQQKDVLMDSVLQLTARLDATSQQLQHLRQLLVSQEQQLPSEEDLQPGQADGHQREFMLRQLIKGTQSERDALQSRLENSQRRLDLAAQHDAEQAADREMLADRAQLLEQQLQQAAGERCELERQLQRQRQHAADCQIEAERVQALLQNANGKILELQQAQAANNRGELETLLDAARHEKSRVDERAADLQEQLSRAQCQLNKLTDEVAALRQHNKVVKNNAKKELSDADYRYDQLLADKNAMLSASQQLQDNIHELEQTCQRHLQDKRQLKAGLSEHQKRAADLQQRLSCVQCELSGCRTRHQQDADEWKQFESDLLMSVRVANDFRTEAQLHVEQMAVDNHRLREQTTLLTGQLDTCRAELAAVKAHVHQLQQHVRPAGDAVVDCGSGSVSDSSPLGERRQPLRAVQSSGGSGTGDQTRPQRLLRQDSKLSVKTLIESLEAKQTQQPGSGSTSPTDSEPLVHPQHPRLTASASSPLFSTAVRSAAGGNPPASLHHVVALAATAPSAGAGGTGARQFVRSYTDSLFSKASVSDSMKAAASAAVEDSSSRPLASILAHKLDAAAALRRGSYQEQIDKKDPLASLVKNGGSRRNALLKWCQTKTMGYTDVDITNFSSSWNDGMALCALLHSYMPDKLPYSTLRSCDKRRNFNTAFEAAESVGIATTLNTNEMVSQDRPDWQQVLAYVTSIYRHFET